MQFDRSWSENDDFRGREFDRSRECIFLDRSWSEDSFRILVLDRSTELDNFWEVEWDRDFLGDEEFDRFDLFDLWEIEFEVTRDIDDFWR